MGDAKGFVQIEVADVATKFAGNGNAHQGVHVGAVHVDAPAVLVNQGAQGLDLGFKHAMGAGVGNHHCRQVGAVLLALGAQVVHVDVALCVAGGHHHLQAGQVRAGRVGAVGRGRDQANIAVPLAVGGLVGAYHQQARIFALAAGIGLQADTGVARGLAQPLAQLGVQQRVALQLVGRGKRVHVGKLGPGDGNHLAGGIELHGATAQRDHAAVQRQVFVAEAADVAQHGRLAVVAVKHGMGEKRAAAAQRCRNQVAGLSLKGLPARQCLAVVGKH